MRERVKERVKESARQADEDVPVVARRHGLKHLSFVLLWSFPKINFQVTRLWFSSQETSSSILLAEMPCRGQGRQNSHFLLSPQNMTFNSPLI